MVHLCRYPVDESSCAETQNLSIVMSMQAPMSYSAESAGNLSINVALVIDSAAKTDITESVIICYYAIMVLLNRMFIP